MSSDVHLLLTKFNVAVSKATTDRPGLSLPWLDQRLDLFKQWTLPSVARQTRSPSCWLIFVDALTPAMYLSRLASITKGLAKIVPVDGILTDAGVAALVRAHVAPSATRLLTSRLDSDDGLARGYLEAVMSQASSWRGFINCPNGLQYASGATLRRLDFRGPFLTMIEDTVQDGLPLTVFSVEHHRAWSVAPVRQLYTPPLWLQVVHGNNLANEVSGIPYPRRRAERFLGWELPASDLSPIELRTLARAAYLEARWITQAPRGVAAAWRRARAKL